LQDNIIFEYLRNIYSTIAIRDIVNRYSLRNPQFLEQLTQFLADNIGNLFSSKKIADFLKSQKIATSVTQVQNYADYLANAFLIHKVPRYDIAGKRIFEIGEKYYFEDLGLRNVRLNFRQTEHTHLMENLIYNELRMRGYSVDVGQVTQNTKNENGISERKQLEVDFVCNRGQDRIYIQSAYALPSEEKTEQELRSLKQIKDSFQKVVIVGGMQPTFRNDDGILILNIFDFLLNRSGQNL